MKYKNNFIFKFSVFGEMMGSVREFTEYRLFNCFSTIQMCIPKIIYRYNIYKFSQNQLKF